MPTAVDLFAGAGGFSLGAQWAGYDVTHAVEVDAWACETLGRNHGDSRILQADLSAVDATWIRRELPSSPDLLIGGPPCQGFSRAGPTKKDPKDPRNSLFREFVRVASIMCPNSVIIENVPGLLVSRAVSGAPVSEIIRSELEALGYSVTVLILEAHKFGVPQIRRRVFFLGSGDAVVDSVLPETHGEPTLLRPQLLPFVTVRDAISDLPLVDVGVAQEEAAYASAPVNDYQRLMRAGGLATVRNHIPMRHSRRIIERFKEIPPGGSQSDVSEEHAPRLRVRTSDQGGARYDQNNRRMFWDRPCHTVPATFYANFVHPALHRNFTPREGARIQSFPDRYVFEGKPTVVSQKLLAREGRDTERHLCQYVQIGNAVPPLLAQHVIEHLSARNTGSEDTRQTTS